MRVCLCLISLLMLVGCGRRDNMPEPLPTRASVADLATAVVLTENAPPAGFDVINFPQITDQLDQLSGWHYTAEVIFDGVFASTTRPAHAETRVEVWYSQVSTARRVVATVQSDLQESPEPIAYEGVRLGPDVFLVRDGVCLSNATADAETIADLSAGLLVGGVNVARAASQKARINSEDVFRYNFDVADVLLPSLGFTDSSQILSASGELWFSPEHRVAVRYYLTLEVENVSVFGSALPVSGTVLLRYDLYDIGIIPNISVPFGC